MIEIFHLTKENEIISFLIDNESPYARVNLNDNKDGTFSTMKISIEEARVMWKELIASRGYRQTKL